MPRNFLIAPDLVNASETVDDPVSVPLYCFGDPKFGCISTEYDPLATAVASTGKSLLVNEVIVEQPVAKMDTVRIASSAIDLQMEDRAGDWFISLPINFVAQIIRAHENPLHS
jgi:hypothetical protein